MIWMEFPLGTVGGGFVFVLEGIDVAVTVGVGVGTVCVGMGVAVARSGVVGNAVGATRVGKGVEPKPNSAVGVACVPVLVKKMGLGVIPEVLRAPTGIKRKRTEHRQQNTNRNKPGKRILPSCPCWLYFAFNTERKE